MGKKRERWDDTMAEFDVLSHKLVPKHEILSEKEAEKVLSSVGITKDQLPKIMISDAAVKRISAQVGDIIKITRESPTAGVSEFYRMVVDIV
jgi:DNA-directed RNA polymerase subunit H